MTHHTSHTPNVGGCVEAGTK